MTTRTLDPTTAPTRRGRTPALSEWLPLAVLLGGTFLVVLDFFIVNVGLPEIQRDLGAGDTALEWLVAGYGLSFGGLLMAASRLGERWGRHRMYAAGVLVFVLASTACGLARGVEVLVVARIAQGLGAAMLAPMVLALLGDVYDGPRRLRALAAYSTVMGVAAACGQLVGGALIAADPAGLGWRSIFLVNLPLGLVVLAGAARVLPRNAGDRDSRVDVPGLVLVTAATTAVILPLLEGRRLGWPEWTWGSLALGGVLALVLVRRTRSLAQRGAAPLFHPAAFGSGLVRRGLVGQALLFCGMASYFMVLALYLQVGRGLGPLPSGLVFTPMALAYMVGTRRAAPLVARFGGGAVVGGAAAFTCGHLLVLLAVGSIGTGGDVLWLVPGLVVAGAGMGVCLSALVGSVMGAVEPRHAATVSGALSTVQQLGNAVGVALIGIVYFGATARGADVAFERSLWWLAAGTTALAVLATRLTGNAGRVSRLDQG
ncbi:MFS transporter [Nocardioides panacisoli]|uniref:MFS transporter n=1 Tax=Nocardioides panacisoli TaxID=627624 RepID=A0ABP7HVQ9_9ACTN